MANEFCFDPCTRTVRGKKVEEKCCYDDNENAWDCTDQRGKVKTINFLLDTEQSELNFMKRNWKVSHNLICTKFGRKLNKKLSGEKDAFPFGKFK